MTDHSKDIYDSAFNILQIQQNLCKSLDSIGLNFEYGHGLIGTSFDQLITNAEEIVMQSLGLTEQKTITKNCQINGSLYPVDIDIWCNKDYDLEFAITADDFSDFFFKAAINNRLRDLMWKAIALKDVSAKTEYNNLNIGTIGITL